MVVKSPPDGATIASGEGVGVGAGLGVAVGVGVGVGDGVGAALGVGPHTNVHHVPSAWPAVCIHATTVSPKIIAISIRLCVFIIHHRTEFSDSLPRYNRNLLLRRLTDPDRKTLYEGSSTSLLTGS